LKKENKINFEIPQNTLVCPRIILFSRSSLCTLYVELCRHALLGCWNHFMRIISILGYKRNKV